MTSFRKAGLLTLPVLASLGFAGMVACDNQGGLESQSVGSKEPQVLSKVSSDVDAEDHGSSTVEQLPPGSGAGGGSSVGGNEKLGDTKKSGGDASKSSKIVTLTALAWDGLQAQDILSLRTSTSLWSFSKDSPSMARAFDFATGAPLANAKNPCATLPKLSFNYGPLLLPTGETDCWSLDATRVIVISQIKEDPSDSGSAFGVTNVSWDLLGKKMSAEELPNLRVLGISPGHLALASKDEFLMLTLQDGTLRLTSLNLAGLMLESPPDSGFLESKEGKRFVTLSVKSELHIAEETASGSLSFLWKKVSTKVEADASLAIPSEELNAPDLQLRFLTDASVNSQGTALGFLMVGSKLYRATVGETLVTDPGTQVSWSGLDFLKNHCASCHSSADSSMGGLRLLVDGQPNVPVLKAQTAVILERIKLPRPNSLAMPPYEPIPTGSDIQNFEESLLGL